MFWLKVMQNCSRGLSQWVMKLSRDKTQTRPMTFLFAQSSRRQSSTFNDSSQGVCYFRTPINTQSRRARMLFNALKFPAERGPKQESCTVKDVRTEGPRNEEGGKLCSHQSCWKEFGTCSKITRTFLSNCEYR